MFVSVESNYNMKHTIFNIILTNIFHFSPQIKYDIIDYHHETIKTLNEMEFKKILYLCEKNEDDRR